MINPTTFYLCLCRYKGSSLFQKMKMEQEIREDHIIERLLDCHRKVEKKSGVYQ